MTSRDRLDLLVLAALWGGSFPFMRVAAPEFGPIALIAARVGIAAAMLLALLARRGGLRALRTHAVPLAVLGVLNSALPFGLLAWSMLSLPAGFASILNATTPLWGALVAWTWLGERPGPWRVAGLALGFAGVVALAWDRASLGPGAGPAIAAGLAATLSYGVAASWTKRRLGGLDPIATAAGSQAFAALALAPLLPFAWPAAMPSPAAWGCVLALGVGSTAIAYLLFFGLIARVGPARAISVTFLVPVFAVAWGALFLGEAPGASMIVGGAIVLAGTALSTGWIDPGRRRPHG